MHTIVIAGRLGRDPEMRYTPDGTPVTTFSVADNAQKDKPVWFKVTAWKRLAEVCNEYLTKGRAVVIRGELKGDDNGGPRVWMGRDGTARASFEVTAASVEFLGDRERDTRGDQSRQAKQSGGSYGPGGGEPPDEGDLEQHGENEIPF